MMVVVLTGEEVINKNNCPSNLIACFTIHDVVLSYNKKKYAFKRS